MSATLDGIAVAKIIGDAQIIEGTGFPTPSQQTTLVLLPIK